MFVLHVLAVLILVLESSSDVAKHFNATIEGTLNIQIPVNETNNAIPHTSVNAPENQEQSVTHKHIHVVTKKENLHMKQNMKKLNNQSVHIHGGHKEKLRGKSQKIRNHTLHNTHTTDSNTMQHVTSKSADVLRKHTTKELTNHAVRDHVHKGHKQKSSKGKAQKNQNHILHNAHTKDFPEKHNHQKVKVERKKCTDHEGCSYKLVTTFSLTSKGKRKKDQDFILLDKIYDETTGNYVYLLKSIVIRLKEEPVTLVYPFKYLYSVNSKPYEMVVSKDNTSNYTGCHVDIDPITSTCGLAYDHSGNIIHDSQGFCCPCKSRHLYHPRGGQDCSDTRSPVGVSDYHDSTHCLKFDKLWYSVNMLGSPHLSQNVFVNVLQERLKKHSKRLWQDFNNGDPVQVGMTERSVKRDKISVDYTGFSHDSESLPINYQMKRLLIPQDSPSIQPKPLSLQNGASEYLLVDHDEIKPSGSECDKVGVSYTAFQNQKDACSLVQQSCLNNQPLDHWLMDKGLSMRNEKGHYWVSNYGKVSDNALIHDAKSKQHFLSLHYDREHTSHLYVTVKADDLVTLQPGLSGQLSDIYTMSTDKVTNIEILVLNTGLVTSFFKVKINHCPASTNINGLPSHETPVNPHKSWRINNLSVTYGDSGLSNSFTCSVELLNDKHQVVATRQFLVKPKERCICVQYCQCKCESSKNWKCVELSQQDYLLAGFRRQDTYTKDTLPKPVVGAVIINTLLLFLLFLGTIKALVGMTISARIGQLGLCLFKVNIRLEDYHETELRGLQVVYDSQGVPVHPVTKLPVRMMSCKKEFFLNVVFFLYIPFVGLHWIWSREKANIQDSFSYIKQKLSRQTVKLHSIPLHEDSSSDSEVEKFTGKPSPIQPQDTFKNDKSDVLDRYREHKRQMRHENVNQNTSNSTSGPVTRSSHGRISISDSMEDVDLSEKTTTTVYRNYTEKCNFLQNSGTKFSLCGTLRESGRYQIFEVFEHGIQMYEIVKGKRQSLEKPYEIYAENLLQSLTARKVKELITDIPLYPCLNHL